MPQTPLGSSRFRRSQCALAPKMSRRVLSEIWPLFTKLSKTLDINNLGRVPERCNNSIPGINVLYSRHIYPWNRLLNLSGTGP